MVTQLALVLKHCSWGSKPTLPGPSSTPLPPPAMGHVPGISVTDLAAYERQLALARMGGSQAFMHSQALMHSQDQGIGGASQAIYDGSYGSIAATTQPPMYY